MIPNCELPRDKQIELIKRALDYQGATIRTKADELFYEKVIGANRPSGKYKIYRPGDLQVNNNVRQ